MMKKILKWGGIYCIVAYTIMLLLFTCTDGRAHETHLSDIGKQTHVSIAPCPILSGYMVKSEERGCFLIHKHTDLAHSELHVQAMDLDEDGDCSCPQIEGE